MPNISTHSYLGPQHPSYPYALATFVPSRVSSCSTPSLAQPEARYSASDIDSSHLDQLVVFATFNGPRATLRQRL